MATSLTGVASRTGTATATSTIASEPSLTSNTSNSSGNGSYGSYQQSGFGGNAVYYGAVALAVVVLMLVSVASRVYIIRRRRRLGQDVGYGWASHHQARARSRAAEVELTDRPAGSEEPGLPTYRETTGTYTLSYNNPVGVGAPSTPISSPLPPDHPMYVPPRGSRTNRPAAAHTRSNGDLERGGDLPEYDGPPKYA